VIRDLTPSVLMQRDVGEEADSAPAAIGRRIKMANSRR
jgi:hypothetical protein